ncbi:MAG: nitrous oxide reductase accessory protein NosL [Leptospira sp.]|nr:nitrous oxide reductase accessory protein NosL [Leptospira sp.]
MWLKRLKYYSIFLMIAFCHCGEAKPEALNVGEVKCAHCSMSIVDLRFHAQLLTDKGKRYHFDAIECMDDFQKQKNIKAREIWLTNFLNKSEFLTKADAIIVQSNKIRSPMGAGLAAFKTQEDAKSFER